MTIKVDGVAWMSKDGGWEKCADQSASYTPEPDVDTRQQMRDEMSQAGLLPFAGDDELFSSLRNPHVAAVKAKWGETYLAMLEYDAFRGYLEEMAAQWEPRRWSA